MSRGNLEATLVVWYNSNDMSDFVGVIIEESLQDKSILKKVHILSTRVERVKETHKTPWLQWWTLHRVAISENNVSEIARELSKALEKEHTWYADFTNGQQIYVIFPEKNFVYPKGDRKQSAEMLEYGVSLGIPEYQLRENDRLF